MFKLLNGEKPLWITFWAAYVVPNAFIGAFFMQPHARGFALSIISILFLIYTIAILRAIWKSASAYHGNAIWSILAKIIVVLNSIRLFMEFSNMLFSPIA